MSAAVDYAITSSPFQFPCDDPACVPANSRPYSRDRNYPSATTLSGLLDKPGLSWAAAKETAVYCLNRQAELAGMDYAEAVDKARKHHSILWREAANMGTVTHTAAEAFARGDKWTTPAELSDEDARQVETFVEGLQAWWSAVDPIVLATELIVRHDNPNVIGSLDLLAIIRGRVTVVDFKNTKKLDGDPYLSDWGRQLGTYMACDTLCHYHAGKLAATLPWSDEVLPRAEVGVIVNIMGDGRVREFEFERNDEVALEQVAALGAIKRFKPVSKQVAVYNEPELVVYPERPRPEVNVSAYLD